MTTRLLSCQTHRVYHIGGYEHSYMCVCVWRSVGARDTTEPAILERKLMQKHVK